MLREDQALWDAHATTDPLWAVLAFPDKRGRWGLQDFMRTGEREIALLFHRLAELQVPVPTGAALDFGCGVGRLTQALARRMERVTGADISPVMIDLARRLNRYPDVAQYMCTADAALETLPAGSFQFVYSSIVLQHVAPELSVRYLREFFRLLGRNGLLVFQLPSHRDFPAEAEIKPMPHGAYQATIKLAGAVPATVDASEELALTLTVRNASDHTWSQPHVGPLAAGNHWLDAAGELMLVQDDGRAALLQLVPPQLEWPVRLTVRAPREPGTYVGEVDLVHEGISWFGHKGSPTLRFTIAVTPNSGAVDKPAADMIAEYSIPAYPEAVVPAPLPSPGPLREADFPMNGVPREQVLDLIHQHGGRLAFLEEDRRAGPEWVSYRYFVVGP